MADRRCDNCGAERGVDGPCPGCGALPVVQLAELDQQAPGEVRRATTADAPQRGVALGVVLVLVALVAGSIVWDSVRAGGDESAGDAAGAADEEDGDDENDEDTTSTSRTSPTSPSPEGEPEPGEGDEEGDGPSIVAPVDGFEDRWLLVVNQESGEVWQVPLGGGEVTPVLGPLAQPLVQSFPPQIDLVGDALVGQDGGVSLVNGERWNFNGARFSYPMGVTGNDTLVFFSETLTERTPTGEIISEWDDVGMGGPMGGYVSHVAGRRAFVSSQHGVYALDLDTQEGRLVLNGSFIVANDQVLLGTRCSGWQQCDVQVIDLDDGSVMSTIEPANWLPDGMSDERGYFAEPELSPDGQRMLVVIDDQLQVVDLTSGDQLGTFQLPDTLDGASATGVVQVVWAPDSSSALVYVTPEMYSESEIPPLLLHIDRDLRSAEPLVQVLEAMHTPAHRELAIILSDRPFEPVPEG